jgi:hypothetical protein
METVFHGVFPAPPKPAVRLARRPLLSDRRVPALVVGAATAVALVRWVLPACWGSAPYTWDAAGHLSAAQTIRDRFWPLPTGWDPGFFGGWPQGRFYPPLTHWLIAAVGRFVPLETAYVAVVGGAAALTPCAAYAFARGRRASRAAAALFSLLLTTVLCAPPDVLRMASALGGTFHSTFEVGLASNAVGLLLFLLGGASFPAALGKRARTVRAACWLAAGVCNHFVAGAALALLFVGDAAARTVHSGRPARVLFRAAVAALLGAGLSAWWWAPMLLDGGYRRIMHIDSDSGPILPVSLALALAAYAVGGAQARKARAVCSGVGTFVVLLVVASALGDASKTAAHFYRFAVYAAAGALHIAACGPFRRTARAAAGLAAGAFLAAFAWHGAPETSRREPPPIAVPADLGPGDRALFAAPKDHGFSAHYLAFELPRRSGAAGGLGLFVESTPLAQHFMELSRATVFDSFTWGVPLDLGRAARLSVEANDPAPMDAATRASARARLRRLYDLFGVTHVVSDRHPPPELVPDPRWSPVVARIASPAAREGPGFETENGAFVFRSHRLEPRPADAEIVRVPLSPVAAESRNDWDLAMERWLFGDAAWTEHPVMARSGLDPSPGDAAAKVEARVDPSGTSARLRIDAAAPAPVLTKIAWHPGWRAFDAAGGEIAVDRAAPGFCLVRARGDVELRWERSRTEIAAAAASCVALLCAAAAVAAAALRRGRVRRNGIP